MDTYSFKGRVWVITDGENNLIADIDTDQIFHNAHLHITDINEMGQFSFGNLHGWEDFSRKAQAGDMILAGSNFGSGSSRQQAVDCFKSLGIRMVIAGSFGAIYKRNAINSGFIITTFEKCDEVISRGKIKNLDMIEVDLLTGTLLHLDSGETFSLSPLTQVQKDIFDQGSLLKI
jgi:3-isopropylmalate dehydratase small subunit